MSQVRASHKRLNPKNGTWNQPQRTQRSQRMELVMIPSQRTDSPAGCRGALCHPFITILSFFAIFVFFAVKSTAVFRLMSVGRPPRRNLSCALAPSSGQLIRSISLSLDQPVGIPKPLSSHTEFGFCAPACPQRCAGIPGSSIAPERGP